MNPLSMDAQSVVDAARAQEQPTAEDRERVKAWHDHNETQPWRFSIKPPFKRLIKLICCRGTAQHSIKW